MDSLSAYFTPEMIAAATKEYAVPGEYDPAVRVRVEHRPGAVRAVRVGLRGTAW